MEKEQVCNKRYDGIDGLRSIMMIMILLMHVLENLNYVEQLGFINKYIAKWGELTSLFMMISAYSCCCGYYNRIIDGGVKEIFIFYKRRFIKVFPFFAILTMIDVIINFSKASLFEGFANFTLVFGLIPHENISTIGVGWTIGVIFVFYMLFPYVVFLMNNNCRFIIALFISLIYTFVCAGYFGLGKVDFLFCLPYFLLGCGIYKIRRIVERMNRLLVLILICACVVGFYGWPEYSHYTKMVMFTLMLIYSVIVKNKTILINRVFKFLSTISYEVYLSHMFIFRILEKIGATKLFEIPLADYCFVGAITLGGTILFSFGYSFVSKKTAEWIKTKYKR